MNKIKDKSTNKTDFIILMGIYAVSIISSFFLINV
jgi:hypothetical protein